MRSATVSVVGPDPSLVASLEVPRVIDHTTTFTPLRALGRGRYQVTWSSVSAVDGSKREPIRDRFRGQLDEALFNAMLAQGKRRDQALAAARKV